MYIIGWVELRNRLMRADLNVLRQKDPFMNVSYNFKNFFYLSCKVLLVFFIYIIGRKIFSVFCLIEIVQTNLVSNRTFLSNNVFVVILNFIQNSVRPIGILISGSPFTRSHVLAQNQKHNRIIRPSNTIHSFIT